MRTRWIAIAAAAACALALLIVPGVAQEEKAAGPFDKMVGTWDVAAKLFMAPGMPPVESAGVEEDKLVLDGKYLAQEYKGDFQGQPFLGLGYLHYDPAKKSFTHVWMDSMGQAPVTTKGTSDENGVTTLVGEEMNPMTGQPMKVSIVIRWDGDDKAIHEMHYEMGPNMKHKAGEFVYT
ncbi:MAG: DUF1579 family protein, partial [Planctomycetota bacterium]